MLRCSLIFVFVFLYYFSLSANCHECLDDFINDCQKFINITNCKRKVLNTQFGWNYNNKLRLLEVVFGAKLDDQGLAWLAWGLNPETEAEMVGTRALIGIKQSNGSLGINTYKIDKGTRLGCTLIPSKIDLNFSDYKFKYSPQTNYYTIIATLVLPLEYNETRLYHVWQVGKSVDNDISPKMHAKSIQNFDSTETINLLSGETRSFKSHRRRNLRLGHGILNIVGWGTLLPIGVIVARYYRKFPMEIKCWKILHISCQIAGWALGSAGWGIGVWLGHASKHFKFPIHGAFGTIIFAFATIQLLAMRLKPDKKNEAWNIYHHFVGYSLLVASIVNIFKGLRIFNAAQYLRLTYIGDLTILVCIFLAFETYTWIKFFNRKKEDKEKENHREEANYPEKEAKISR